MRNGSGVNDHQHAAQTLGHPGERVRHAVGLAIAELARLATRGHVYGVDHSQVMVSQARRRNAAAVRAHRVHLTQASVDQLPGFDRPLDAILAVNSSSRTCSQRPASPTPGSRSSTSTRPRPVFSPTTRPGCRHERRRHPSRPARRHPPHRSRTRPAGVDR
ncbi:class I SAM-dependent methyltransferase [Nonomuraea sp. ATR24]|uniref:class I SAM-dependent methyltransferase n=1 Tax=Nonomuraea sp. ATR24 TaxID=1676744 RepID=UPI0035C02E33